MKQTCRWQAVVAALLLVMGAVVARADHGDNNNNNNNAETRLRTRLAGAAIQGKTPEGNADFRSDSRGRMRLNVEVENVNLPAATVLSVSVLHGTTMTLAGHITLNAFGGGELELDSQDGAVVPAVQSGDMVVVSNAATPILSGTF